MWKAGRTEYQNIIHINTSNNYIYSKLRNITRLLLKCGAYFRGKDVPDGVDVRTDQGAVHRRFAACDRHRVLQSLAELVS